MMFYRIASALLEYPDAELRAALPEIRAAVVGADDVAPEERGALNAFLDQLDAQVLQQPLALEEEYVRTFDMVPEHSLHLTHHLIGEDKNRGPALIDLGEYYKEYGLDISEEAKEIPDYLPLILEFISLLEADEARLFLSGWTKVLRQLRVNLEEAGSRYASLLQLIEARSLLVAAEGLNDPLPETKTDPLQDDGDFDPPVDWSSPPALNRPCSA
ncbi:Nitrate reductase, delta subunit [Sterolibacterium denitrificans]|uniref:Nitrate reductase, delta subunit n=1 Tax=Sterolibacterium denitrificans TaxID=157592 RepID=A0A7Z7HNK5_9PROT|nr:nitrate reductase molybdenum cofactor assembly chaperone [Sterolibacterium denitrificans]SMB21220.1 Nitrate reductase, delta subunit [Sterolibacterium denitrificans]